MSPGVRGRGSYMETFHGRLGLSLLQGINDPQFEDTPVVKGPDPEKVNQREELFDLILTTAKLSNLGSPKGTRDLTWECR